MSKDKGLYIRVSQAELEALRRAAGRGRISEFVRMSIARAIAEKEGGDE